MQRTQRRNSMTSKYWAVYWALLKAMLHEEIFLATCNATMTTGKHCKLQRRCHTFAISFSQLATRLSPAAILKFARAKQRTRSDWLNLVPRASAFRSAVTERWCWPKGSRPLKTRLWLAHFNKITLQVVIDMSHAATLRKVEDSFTFPATHNATFAPEFPSSLPFLHLPRRLTCPV